MEHLEGLSAIGELSSGGAARSQQLDHAVQDALEEAAKTSQISEISSDVRNAIQMNRDASPVDESIESLMETKPGIVNNEMEKLIGGGSTKDQETDVNLDAMEQMTDRIRTVYLDLANFTVAWKIVNTSRQDLSRLLTSS